MRPAAIWDLEGRLVSRARFFIDPERARRAFEGA
jgi:hypothetical protein